MPERCTNQSVGVLLWKDGRLLLEKRKNIPFGFAPTAGHVDPDETYEEAAKREVGEEVGLTVLHLAFLGEGPKPNNECRRSGGKGHYWKVFSAEWEGDLAIREEEVAEIRWCSLEELRQLAVRTDEYILGRISEEEWEEDPGLEVVWREWLAELSII